MFVKIQKDGKRTYSRQIYTDIREKILKGDLAEGAVLPSSRDLSLELAVSRNTVLTAFDMLVSEGFASSIPGSGLYVNQGAQLPRQPVRLSDSQTATLTDDRLTADGISFDSGIPALDLFPRSKWNSHIARAFREAPVTALGYDDPQGRPEFRAVLSDYLKRSRGIDCHPDQIIVTCGAKQGLTLTAKCLLDEGSEVIMEDPSNRNVVQIFSYHTKYISPVPVDEEGIITAKLPKNRTPSLLFVTPSHQFPKGGILSVRRRLELIRYARETGCILVEDDYDSEFRYDGTPVSSLFELDPERVIYIGTFSKVLYPSLRLGYVVLPSRLVMRFREWKRLSDHHSDSISQLALMRLIECGDLERHIRHMKKIYRNRRDCITNLLHRYFPNQYQLTGTAAGMHGILALEGIVFSSELIRRIRESGVYAVPVEDHALVKGCHPNQIILGYAHLSPHEMELGLQRIRESIRI